MKKRNFSIALLVLVAFVFVLFIFNMFNIVNLVSKEERDLSGEEFDEELIVSLAPPYDHYRVFVSSQTYNGSLGGVSGANQKCQNLANNVVLGGNWSAWISDSTTSPSSSFFKSTLPYKRIDGQVIANNWSDLTDGSLNNSINVNETGQIILNSFVWTGTGFNGSGIENMNCDNWTSDLITPVGKFGNSSKTDSRWTEFNSIRCNQFYGLYCFEQPWCGNSILEIGETCDDNNAVNGGGCSSRCIFENDYCGNKLSENLKFYEIRYRHDTIEPRPVGLAEFTIGVNYGNLKNYPYVWFSTILGHALIDRASANATAVMMNASELDALFEGRTFISQDKIQKKDIEKIHKELFSTEPDLNYGVILNSSGDVILDDKKNPTLDSSIEDYQNGKTIVYPISIWRDVQPTRFFFNFNTPAVREYAIRYSLMRQSLFTHHALYIDGPLINDMLFFNTTDTYHYVSSGTKEEQMKVAVNHIISILNEIKIRPDRDGEYNNGTILNNFRDGSQVGLVFLNEIDRQENYSVFDMMLNENRFWKDGYSANIEFYLNWTNKLKAHGKELIYAVSVDPRLDSDSDFVEDVWFWLHLVANESYVYINRGEYNQPMKDYAIYNFTLGNPLESVHKEGDTWIREYQRGTIIFNVSSEKIDSIRFVQNSCNVCGNSVAETGEQCDDGNTQDGDGCSASCHIEILCESGADIVIVDGIVDQNELNSYIQQYYLGNVNINNVSNAIDEHLNGCG